jgi:hypothetical protein
MALEDTHWLRMQQFILDGVRYDISVCRCGDGLFQSSWLCSNCGEKGVLEPTGQSSDEVQILAKIGIRVHHQLCH